MGDGMKSWNIRSSIVQAGDKKIMRLPKSRSKYLLLRS